MMRAVVCSDAGGPDSLRIQEVAAPQPGPTELLIRVRASALNRADLLQTMGLYPAPPDAPADIPGLEYAGEVVAVGVRVRRFKAGDKVMGIVSGGAFAELVLCHEREAMPMPERMSFTEAAAIPEAFLTAFDGLILQGALRATETVLVHAAGSGVGTAACQLGNAFGATVIGTTRSQDKLGRLRALGMHHGVDSTSGSFAKAVKDVSAGRGADVVLDLVTGTTFQETAQALAPKARWILVGLLAGSQTQVDLGVLLHKRVRIMGTVLRSRPLEEKIEVAIAAERVLLPLFNAGKLKPVVDSQFPMGQLRDAFNRLSSNGSFGKIVVEWG